MDKANIVNTFTGYVDQLRNTECSQKEKMLCFQHIAQCIMSPVLAGHINYATHCSTATNVLLLFCEDFDSVVRMSAEENLNRIFRFLEKTRVSRILMDLYGEIKRNGNQRSLRICLNLFSYYAPRIKEKHITWYAVRLLPCLQTIAQRKETLLCETLCEFVKNFGAYLQLGLTDSETCKLFDVFVGSIGVECAVKRRCSSQNCISLIENSRNKSLMAKHGLSKVIELLLTDQQTHTVLGALGFLRLLLPLIIRGFHNDYSDDADAQSYTGQSKKGSVKSATPSVIPVMTSESRQIIEIYDYCLHLLSNSNNMTNHSTINAALEVVNAILQAVNDCGARGCGKGKNNATVQSLQQLLCNQKLEHSDYLKRRKSLKNQIVQLRNYEKTSPAHWRGGGVVDSDASTADVSLRNFRITKDNSKQRQADVACKRGGAEAADAKMFQLQQEVEQHGSDVAALAENAVGIYGTSGGVLGPSRDAVGAVGGAVGVGRGSVSDDVDMADNDDEARQSLTNFVKQPQKQTQKHVRNTPRSISECVEFEPADDVGADAEAEEDEDDFTTLSEINEPQQTFALSTAIDVDNLIDAIDATATTTGASSSIASSEMAHTEQQQPQNLLTGAVTLSPSAAYAGDDKSQTLSDIDNESFNSIDFEAEITIGGAAATTTGAPVAGGDGGGDAAAGGGGKSNSDAIGSFFNNLISHSNAASESVSKLFRQSSTTKPATPIKTSVATDKSDAASTATSVSALDSLSFTSIASRTETAEVGHVRKHSNVSSSGGGNEDTFSSTASATASTAVVADTNTRNTAADNSSDESSGKDQPDNFMEVELRRKPNANPFLLENSPLKQTVAGLPALNIKIGTIHEQSIITYTARLIAAHFLLTGQARGSLHNDAAVRISIKSLSLSVLAQCVRLSPAVLQMTLVITELELSLLEPEYADNSDAANKSALATETTSSQNQPQSDSSNSSNLSNDYEHLDVVDFLKKSAFSSANQAASMEMSDETLLLEIKDDHFGKSTCDYFLSQPLSRSADPVLLTREVGATAGKLQAAKDVLSKSDIIETVRGRGLSGGIAVTQSTEDAPPAMLPPRPPKRIKSLRKSKLANVKQIDFNKSDAGAAVKTDAASSKDSQSLADVLLYYQHADPMLRGGVQQIIGNFLQASGAGLTLQLQLNLQHLLAILLKGLQDDIHTVVIQALNAFDKIFPHVMSKYLTAPACHYQQQRQQDASQSSPKQNPAHPASGCRQNAPNQQRHQNANDVRCPSQASGSSSSIKETLSATCPRRVSDNDELMAALLNAFQMQSHCADNNDAEGNGCATGAGRGGADCRFFISPKLLLNKLRLCHHNKYWLVQNKYAEVISNLNYAALDAYYGNASQCQCSSGDGDGAAVAPAADDVVCTYETIFLDELLLLIGNDDFRVREYAAKCICRFIMQNARQHSSSDSKTAGSNASRTAATAASINSSVAMETYQTNFNLLWDFFDYRIFSGMSMALRNLFRANSTVAPPTTSSSVASAAYDGGNRHAAFAMRRQMAQEEKVLAKVLYRMTNKLMQLNDKNSQFGIIYTLKLLLQHFSFVDYQRAWTEFNFMEICMKFCYFNYTTAVDLSCQNDLIDVTGKLMAGFVLTSPNILQHQEQLDQLLQHCLKLINIYYHIVTNQKPLQSSKTHKTDIFTNAKEFAVVNSVGYFGGDYVYIKLYNLLKSANDSYKITVNQESGRLLISLLRTCLETLSLCIELRMHPPPPIVASPAKGASIENVFPSRAVLKLIEEILQYLAKLINYVPSECIACLRQLLKYLFGQNYGNRQQDYYCALIQPYFVAKCRGQYNHAEPDATMPSPRTKTINPDATTATPARTTPASTTMTSSTQPPSVAQGSAAGLANYEDTPSDAAGHRLFGELFRSGLNFHIWRSEREGECGKHIKLFEPLVIYCLTLFMKSNAKVQAPILELLCQLLDLNVTYSILDSKNVIFDQIMNNLELIENGIARNGHIIIPPMIKFLIQLTHKSDRKLITIPKIISITNNLLANNVIPDSSLLALKSLAYEIFFMEPITPSPAPVAESLHTVAAHPSPIAVAEARQAGSRELDTQKEVLLGMLEKFIDASECQQVLGVLMLSECCAQQRMHDEAQRESEKMHKIIQETTPMTVRTTAITTLWPDSNAVYALVCRAMCEDRICVDDWNDFFVLDAFFRNNGKNLLAGSREFSTLLQLFFTKDVANFGDLSYATIILANVILKTEEIYLVNHIKLYLKNHPAVIDEEQPSPPLHWLHDRPSTSSAAAMAASTPRPISEINYFAKFLCNKLVGCFNCLTGLDEQRQRFYDTQYCGLVVCFIRALHDVCCGPHHKDALQTAFRLVLAESEFLDKYYSFLVLMAGGVAGSSSGDMQQDEDVAARLLLEVFKLLLAMKLLDPLVLLQQIQTADIKWNVRKTLLREVCLSNGDPLNWNLQQVQQLFQPATFLNFLIAEHLPFVGNLCEVDEEFCSLLQSALLRHAQVLDKFAVRSLCRLVVRFSSGEDGRRDHHCSIQCRTKFLVVLSKLYELHSTDRALQLQFERLARLLLDTSAHNKMAVYEAFVRSLGVGEAEPKVGQLQFALLNDLNNMPGTISDAGQESRIIDEKWLFNQLIKFSTQPDYDPLQLTKILLEIQSENKLHKIFNNGAFNVERVLRTAIGHSLATMLANFRNNCVQHNPHIHYMQPNPLARVACVVLMARIAALVGDSAAPADQHLGSGAKTPATVGDAGTSLYLCGAVITLIGSIGQIEATALIYIESKFIDKFLREHFLRPDYVRLLLRLLDWCCRHASQPQQQPRTVAVLLSCIDALLQQPLIWNECQLQAHAGLQCRILDVLVSVTTKSIQNTIFYKRHKATPTPTHTLSTVGESMEVGADADADSALLLDGCAPKAIFIAKLIEAISEGETLGDDFGGSEFQVPMRLLTSIGISILRAHQFYAYAVTPGEIVQQQQHEARVKAVGAAGDDSPMHRSATAPMQTSGKLPTIPVDSLSDVVVLRKFIKRLSIFGFTTRQQFEEYFMTFLLLINKVYDENMVDQQEQFQIKSICLEAILQLLITYKTFPIVGSNRSRFHHTPRWSRINCDSISLKKLHKVQLLVSPSNVFYHPNLERQLRPDLPHKLTDTVIGTADFLPNQYDLNFAWQQMEIHAQSLTSSSIEVATNSAENPEADAGTAAASAGGEDIAMKNFHHFTKLSGVDFKSSTQLIYDVLMQIIEHNHVLVLPNLVQFCEICESREQIKSIKEKALKLHESIPMDDTISHQHLIYLVCKTQAMLLPTLGEMQQLCALIGNYLKSSHVFIRNATLAGVLCLLECCSKTNTTIGRLSEELSLLRDLSVAYINRHGIVEESSMKFSDTHSKLVWTLNYCVIEWTSKFVPQCHLLSNTVIAANNFLKKTNNLDLYLCVLHGLERIVVIDNMGGTDDTRVVSPELRFKIEKLALDLVKLENELFSIPALKLLLSCMYVGSAKQLENTELSNGIVQDDPEIIAQQTDKVDILLHCIKSSTRDAAWIYGQVLCQIIRDLVPPNELLTKVIKELLAINQPHCDVIAMIVYQVFRSAIDSSFLQMLQEWLICSVPTFLEQSAQKGVWGLSVIFLSASINLHLIKLFPVVLGAREFRKLGQHEIALFVTAAHDFHAKLTAEQKLRFQDAFKKFQQIPVYNKMLQSL